MNFFQTLLTDSWEFTNCEIHAGLRLERGYEAGEFLLLKPTVEKPPAVFVSPDDFCRLPMPADKDNYIGAAVGIKKEPLLREARERGIAEAHVDRRKHERDASGSEIPLHECLPSA